jgi:hypothetical protein
LLAHLMLDPGQHRSHAAQAQRAHQVLQPEPAGELAWRRQDLVRTQPGIEDAGKPRVVGDSRGASKNR